MPKIEGSIGSYTGRFVVLQVAMEPPEYIAVEEFLTSSGHCQYIKMKLPLGYLKDPGRIPNWFKKNYREFGEFCDRALFLQGHSLETIRTRPGGDFSSQIATDPHTMTMQRIKKLRRMSEDLDDQFYHGTIDRDGKRRRNGLVEMVF